MSKSVKKVTVLRRKELLKIFYAVAKTLTLEEISWLKKDTPAIWESFTHLASPDGLSSPFSDWEIHNFINVYSVSFRIQEMCDAKAGRHLAEEKTFGEGLPKIYLAEIAKMFGIVSKEIDSNAVKMNKWQLANAILEKC